MQCGKICEFCNETKDKLKALKSKLICIDCIKEITGNFQSSFEEKDKNDLNESINNTKSNPEENKNEEKNENTSNDCKKPNRQSFDLNVLKELNVEPEDMEELLYMVDESVGKIEEIQKTIEKFKENKNC